MPGRTKLRQGQTQTSKEEGGSTSRTTAQIEKYYSGGKRPFTYKKNDRGKVIKVELKGGGMSSGQAKIAAKAPPPNKIDAKDFAVLKAEKAKGRGMGLQDEKIKPGKVMKANKGKEIKADPTKTITDKGQFVKRRMKLTGSKLPGRIGTALGIGSMLVPAAYAAAKQYKDYKSAKNRDKAKVKKMGGGMMRRYSSGAMAEDRAMEGRKAAYKKMGFEAMMKSGEIKFPGQDKKRTRENPMKEERFQRTRQSQIAKVVGKENVSDPRKVERKMVGGMAKKYSVGGGADMGRKNKKSKSGSSVKDIFKSYGKYDGKPIELGIGGGIEKAKEHKKIIKDKAGTVLGYVGEMAKTLSKATPAGAALETTKKVAETINNKKEQKRIGRFEDRIQMPESRRPKPTLPGRPMPFPLPGRPRDAKPMPDVPGKKRERKPMPDVPGRKRKAIPLFGGGMMKPMGYKSGTMVKARGCKLGRSKPTKMY